MKKLIIPIIFSSIYISLFAQNPVQTDDMTTLKKQVTTLNNSTAILESRLKTFMKTSKIIDDSLQIGLDENSIKLKIISDSLVSTETHVNILKTESEKIFIGLKSANILHYIIFILILLIVLVTYFLLSKKTEKLNSHLQEIKENFDLELNKIKKDFTTEISSAKEELEKKIKEKSK
jgi:hypothetical protein